MQELCKPEPFGYKLTWLAIQNADPFELLHAVNTQKNNVFPANWQGGLDKVYQQNATFITPAVAEWTFVINPAIAGLTDKKTLAFLQLLSIQFGEAQFYGNHRVANYGAWGRFVNGKAVRIFSTNDSIALDQGQLTAVEKQIIAKGRRSFAEDNPDDSDQLDDSFFLGKEDDVMAMAGLWSINPQSLDNQPATSAPGLLTV